MVDHLNVCSVLVSSRERIITALAKQNNEYDMLNTPQDDTGTFFIQASLALTTSREKVFEDLRLVKKAARRSSTKSTRLKAA